MVIFFVFSGVGSFPPPSSGGSTGGIVELSSKNTSFVNLSLSTYPLIPFILPLSAYCHPAQLFQVPLLLGRSAPYSATHKGYFVFSPDHILLAVYALLYKIACFPLSLSTSLKNVSPIRLISALFKFPNVSKSIANLQSMSFPEARATKNFASFLAASSVLAAT